MYKEEAKIVQCSFAKNIPLSVKPLFGSATAGLEK